MHRLLDTLRRTARLLAWAAILMAWHPPAVNASGPESQAVVIGGPISERGFTLQVGAYAERTVADALASRLDGAWVQEVRSGAGPMYRVNYRRFDERSAAVRAQWELEDLGYKSFVQQLFA